MKTRFNVPLLFLILALFSNLQTHAGTPGAPDPVINPKLVSQTYLNSSQPFTFMENRGQLADENGKLLSDIHYYGHQNGVNVYCRNNKLSFVFTKRTEEKTKNEDSLLPEKFRIPGKTTVETARMDMCFLNANPSPTIQYEDAIEFYTNYYLAHTPEEGVTHVRSFKKLTYKNLYPNIDMVLLSKEKGMEYEFLVHPGGKVSDIQIQWLGADKMQPTPEGGIHYANALGDIDESMPISFTSASKVSSRFLVRDNIVRYEVGEYDKGETLVIDPALVWGTYFGGYELEDGKAICSDKGLNIYSTGRTFTSSGLTTSGTYQSIYQSLSTYSQAYLVKFDNSGKKIWGSYYGGPKNNLSWTVVVDLAENVIIAGYTASTTGIATTLAHQTSMGGGLYDGFVAKFTKTGARIWSTYYGGSEFEGCTDICVDKKCNIYITGVTLSKNGIASVGAYLSSGGGTQYDSYISKFDSSGKRLWGTYFGGKRDENSYGISTDTGENVFITGYTLSSNNIATSSAFQKSIGAGDTTKYDAYLSKFNKFGNLIWSTYFGGEGKDIGMSVCTDDSGYIFLVGTTTSTSGIALSSAFQNSYTGNTDVFLSRFDGTGKRLWSTYYGGSGNEAISDICTLDGKVFFMGNTESTNQIASSNAAKKYITSSSFDVYLSEFSTQGQFLYGTYYGGEDYDIGSGITLDTIGNVFLSGYTVSKTGVATSGAFQHSHSGNWDSFLAKFDFNLPCSSNSQIFGDSIVCTRGKNTYFTNQKTGVNYIWNINGGIVSFGAYTDSIEVLWGVAGKGSIQLITINKQCTNSPKILVTILPLPITKIFQIRISAKSHIFFTKDTNFTSYNWFFGDGKDSLTTYHINHTYPKDSSYKVTLVTTGSNGCQATMDTLLKVYTYLDKQSNPISLPLSIKPNPFTDQTTISYILPTESIVQITLWDMAGRQVAVLTEGRQGQGEYDCLINASNLGLSQGNYLVKILMDGQLITRQIIKIKE